MYFVIEESSWVSEDPESVYMDKIEQWLDRLDAAFERNEDFQASRALFDQQIFGATLAEFLWGGHLPREIQERIDSHFHRMSYWDDTYDYIGFDATIGSSEITFSPSAVLAHHMTKNGHVIACLPLAGAHRGPHPTMVDGHTEIIHFVVDETTHRAFFRAAVHSKKLDVSAVETLAPHAFPGTCFVATVWRELRDFDGGYPRVRETLLGFLAAFDDHAHWIYTDETGRITQNDSPAPEGRRIPVTRQLIEQRFQTLGFDVVPESLDVYQDSRCRSARERQVADRTIYCEWHYRIQRHINRVHLHGPIEESEDRPIVAIFCGHLPTPGA